MNRILFFFFLPLCLASQGPNLVLDINPGPAHSTFGGFAVLPNHQVVFGVNTPSVSSHGLWVSDGSVAGTQKIKNLSATKFTTYNAKHYFTAATPGYILWRTDGTTSGTDSIPVPSLLFATNFIVHNNLLFFIGNTVANGNELWRSDGTTAGTFMVKDIWSAGGNAINSNWKFVTQANGLYFVANDGVHGSELWKSDGSTAGTILLKDINPGTASSNIGLLNAGNNGVYFMADNGMNGSELWFSDGTLANTHLVDDHTPGSGSTGNYSNPVFQGNDMYFTYDAKVIQKTNGLTLNTTTLQALSPPSPTVQYGLQHPVLINYNSDMYYIVLSSQFLGPPVNADRDTLYLFKTDYNLSSKTLVAKTGYNRTLYSFLQNVTITQAGSKLVCILYASNANHVFVFDVSDGSISKFYGAMHLTSITHIEKVQIFANRLYFPAYGSNAGYEPCFVDLTSDSLKKFLTSSPIALTCPSPASAGMNYSHEILTLNNKHYLIGYTAAFGNEFYEVDFTGAGISLLKDIYPGSTGYYGNSPSGGDCNNGNLHGIVTPNNVFFSADDGVHGLELWAFITNVNPLYLNEPLASDDIVLFPNPSTGRVEVKSPVAISEITLINLQDQELLHLNRPPQNHIELNLSDWPAGLYLLRIVSSKGTVIKKLLIE